MMNQKIPKTTKKTRIHMVILIILVTIILMTKSITLMKSATKTVIRIIIW